MINLVLECIDRLHIYSSAAHFAEVAGREAGEAWTSILNSLYELLGEGGAGARAGARAGGGGGGGGVGVGVNCLLGPQIGRASCRARV